MSWCTVWWYSSTAIESWRDAWLKDYLFEDAHSPKILADLRERLFRKLQMLSDATTDADLRTVERQPGGLAFHSRQRPVAAALPVGRRTGEKYLFG
jgi:hypothetical protein